MKRRVKHALARGLFASHVDAVLSRGAAVVVAFHRVQETDGTDPLTVTPDLFERYCLFFKRHFRVTSVRDVIDRLEHGRPLDHALAITFDDGYRDNFEIAAPILERLGLTATFFVVTGWLGTDVVPWWDRQRGVSYPWMSWHEARALRAKGFGIGAHTRTHVDLGAVTLAEARDEIFGARLDLEGQLGAPVEAFAYPYGRRRHLTDAARELVRKAGFRCCCSGYGGANASGTDPFSLHRVPISPWDASPLDFGFDVLLGRSMLAADAGSSADGPATEGRGDAA